MGKKSYTFSELEDEMRKAGCNLADIAIGRMMVIIEEETGKSPNWDDVAPDWVVRNCMG